ncbi:MAG: helix-turn-helix domain-containing protein [Acidimicrobiia bacterium]|nr:helix-turn-helix domain-containing protein [Acidimicrobiia bacterium]
MVVVPGRLAGPLWRLLGDALRDARRNGRQDLDELEQLQRDLMAAALAASRDPVPSDVGSAVDAGSSEAPASYVPVVEAAGLLEVSGRRVRQLLESGQLSGRRSGALWLVDVASIEERLVGGVTS